MTIRVAACQNKNEKHQLVTSFQSFSYSVLFFTKGIWTHLAVVYNGGLGKVKIFVDGVKILTTTKGVVKQAHVPWSSPVTIGKLTGNDVQFFAGALDEFYIFTGALVHSEVEALMSKCEFPSGSRFSYSYSY